MEVSCSSRLSDSSVKHFVVMRFSGSVGGLGFWTLSFLRLPNPRKKFLTLVVDFLDRTLLESEELSSSSTRWTSFWSVMMMKA